MQLEDMFSAQELQQLQAVREALLADPQAFEVAEEVE